MKKAFNLLIQDDQAKEDITPIINSIKNKMKKCI